MYSCIWSKVSNVKSAAVSRNYVFYFDSEMTIVSPSSQILPRKKKLCVFFSVASFLVLLCEIFFSFFVTVILTSTFLSLNRFFPFKNKWIYKNIIYCTWRCLHFHQMRSDNRSSINNNNSNSKHCFRHIQCDWNALIRLESSKQFICLLWKLCPYEEKKKKMKFILT